MKSYQFKNQKSQIKRKLLKESNYKCNYCDKEITLDKATIDHIVPKSRGGGNGWGNLAVCCQSCNSSKYVKTLFEWANDLMEKYKYHVISSKKYRKKIENIMIILDKLEEVYNNEN